MDDKEAENHAHNITEETVEMGDTGAESPPDGQKCERDDCDEDAVPGPGDEWLCRDHQKEFFRERHG